LKQVSLLYLKPIEKSIQNNFLIALFSATEDAACREGFLGNEVTDIGDLVIVKRGTALLNGAASFAARGAKSCLDKRGKNVNAAVRKVGIRESDGRDLAALCTAEACICSAL